MRCLSCLADNAIMRRRHSYRYGVVVASVGYTLMILVVAFLLQCIPLYILSDDAVSPLALLAAFVVGIVGYALRSEKSVLTCSVCQDQIGEIF